MNNCRGDHWSSALNQLQQTVGNGQDHSEKGGKLMYQINSDLKEYVENNIIPQYTYFDKGHDSNHVNEVLQNSFDIAKNYDVDIDMVFTTAAYHDVGIKFGRKTHNITSAQILREDLTLKKWFSDEQITIIAQAIEDHRASNDYEPRTIYGKIISEADRVIDVDRLIYRTTEYGKANFPNLTIEEQFERIYDHITRKFGENGYMKLWLNTKRNTDALNVVRMLLNDKEQMRKMVYKILEK